MISHGNCEQVLKVRHSRARLARENADGHAHEIQQSMKTVEEENYFGLRNVREKVCGIKRDVGFKLKLLTTVMSPTQPYFSVLKNKTNLEEV